MNREQILSLKPALADFLNNFRQCFKRDKTFGYLQKYMMGLLADLQRKSIEPIALSTGVPVRTLQEFLAFFKWDEELADKLLVREVVNRQHGKLAIGILDSSAHVKQGKYTPGVQRQWCNETGKKDNCVIGQHLLYTDNDSDNPFSCVVASDLYLPESWAEDRQRCQRAGIPDDLTYRTKWQIAIDQLKRVMAEGLRFDYITFDEEYGRSVQFFFELDSLGQKFIGEVPKNFRVWVSRPSYRSNRAEYSSSRVDDVVKHSPAFYKQRWQKWEVNQSSRGKSIWSVKYHQVYLVRHDGDKPWCPMPTDRTYWLIVLRNDQTRELKYFISNAPVSESISMLLAVAFCRWRVEQWFRQAKQECGFGSFEVRTYKSLIRHWLTSRLAMYFLADRTHHFRKKKSADNIGAGS